MLFCQNTRFSVKPKRSLCHNKNFKEGKKIIWELTENFLQMTELLLSLTEIHLNLTETQLKHDRENLGIWQKILNNDREINFDFGRCLTRIRLLSLRSYFLSQLSIPVIPKIISVKIKTFSVISKMRKFKFIKIFIFLLSYKKPQSCHLKACFWQKKYVFCHQ